MCFSPDYVAHTRKWLLHMKGYPDLNKGQDIVNHTLGLLFSLPPPNKLCFCLFSCQLVAMTTGTQHTQIDWVVTDL